MSHPIICLCPLNTKLVILKSWALLSAFLKFQIWVPKNAKTAIVGVFRHLHFQCCPPSSPWAWWSWRGCSWCPAPAPSASSAWAKLCIRAPFHHFTISLVHYSPIHYYTIYRFHQFHQFTTAHLADRLFSMNLYFWWTCSREGQGQALDMREVQQQQKGVKQT